MPSISTKKFSTNRDFSHIADFEENVIRCLICKRKRETFMELAANSHYFAPIPKERKIKIQHDDVNNVGKNKSRKESRYVCRYCKDHPALCIHPCLRIYHQDIGVAKHQEEITIEVAEELWNFDCRLHFITNKNKQQNNSLYLFSCCKFTHSLQKSILSPELIQMCSNTQI